MSQSDVDSSAGPSAGFGRFFLPGPTEVRQAVLSAQDRPVIGHRGPPIQELLSQIQLGLQELFRTARPVLVSTSSATGLMEAAVRNGATDRVLSLVNGAFSERFAAIARACGLEVDVLEVPWGESHRAEALEARLARGRYDAVTVVHSETSTGALNPISALSPVVREAPGTLLLVDSVTGVGGARLHTDDWGLDFVLTGSQKAMALPPGLAFAVASERMMERSARATRKGVYFDLVSFYQSLEKRQTPNTPAVTLLFALAEQLRYIADEGVEGRWSRHEEMARACWDWVEDARVTLGLDVAVLAPEGARSPTVTCIRLPADRSGPKVVEAMKRRGFVIGAGYGKLKQETVRIGHMGDHTVEELGFVLDAMEEVLTG